MIGASRVFVLLAVALLACGESDHAAFDALPTADGAAGSDADGATADAAAFDSPPAIDPLIAPIGEWTWFELPDAVCGNGAATGLGLNLAGDSNELVVFLNGGGACWDNNTCFVLKVAANIESGYDGKRFAVDKTNLVGVGPFNRADAANPFRDAHQVFIPYCTGDVFSGDEVVSYAGGTVHHVGFANIAAYLARLRATFPDLQRLYLIGSSAGGLGATYNWGQFVAAFPSARVDMISDSGPWMPPPYLSEALEQSWRASWNLAGTLPADCAACADDLDALYSHFAQKFSNARGALLTYMQDGVIATYLSITKPQMELGLYTLASRVGANNFKFFAVSGDSHVMLGNWTGISQGGVSVRDFITLMITDDPSWTTIAP